MANRETEVVVAPVEVRSPGHHRRHRTMKHVLSVALIAALAAPNTSAHPPDVDAEIAALDALIEKVGENPHTAGSVLWLLEEAERQTLALARAGLLAQQAGAPIPEGERPAPNPERAAELLGAIVDTEREVKEAEREAASAGGLSKAVALLTVATGKLTTAQLRLAWYEARFGLPLSLPPMGPADGDPDALATAPPSTPEPPPKWADPAHPEIDYSEEPFQSRRWLADRFAGWWAIRESTSPIDDSREVYATNLSAARWSEHTLIARCSERRLELIYQPDAFLIAEDGAEDTFRVIARIDDASARNERWNGSTNNKAVFHPHPRQVLQELIVADRLFLRVHERRERHDATFTLAGAGTALSEVAAACGHTLITRAQHAGDEGRTPEPPAPKTAERLEYVGKIKETIERNWLRPPGNPTGLKCVVRVSQIPGGEVVQVEIRTSSGNVAFDRSVEDAVLRASPLPVPKDPALFDRYIVITFEPD